MSNENFKEFYQLDLSALAEKLKTSSSGLSRGFAAERLQEVGFNQLREERKRSVWQMAYEQYRNPMIILLLIAAFISWLLGELKDTFVILMIVLPPDRQKASEINWQIQGFASTYCFGVF